MWATMSNAEERMTCGVGANSHVGAGNDCPNDELWHRVAITAGKWMVNVVGNNQCSLGIDNDGNIWEWGSNSPH